VTALRDHLCNRASGDALVPILSAVLTALDCLPCPQNQMLGRMAGLTVSQIDLALARGIATGKLRRDMRRRARRLVVLDEGGKVVAATDYSRSGGGSLPSVFWERAKAAARAAGGNPLDDGINKPIAQRAVEAAQPRVNTVRCPFCNLPPDHGECRHGWNGLTTITQRRAIATELRDVAA